MVVTVNVVSSRGCGRVHSQPENIGDGANRHPWSQSDAGPEPGERVKGEPAAEPGVVISAGTLSFRPLSQMPSALRRPPPCPSTSLSLYARSAGHSTQLRKPLGTIRSHIRPLVPGRTPSACLASAAWRHIQLLRRP